MSKVLYIKDFVPGDTAISYDDGNECLQEILKATNNQEEVTLDFSGIDYVITAFLNPIIGDLILQNGNEIMKSIKIVNVNKKTIEKIKMVKDGALLKERAL